MTRVQKNRFYLISFLFMVSILAVYLIILALKSNINFFYSPSEVSSLKLPLLKQIRVGGLVEKGSIVRGKNLEVQFKITDLKKTLLIQYSGILPDLFREGQGIVAKGQLQENNVFLAEEILAKHDENYMPPEIKDLKVPDTRNILKSSYLYPKRFIFRWSVIASVAKQSSDFLAFLDCFPPRFARG